MRLRFGVNGFFRVGWAPVSMATVELVFSCSFILKVGLELSHFLVVLTVSKLGLLQ